MDEETLARAIDPFFTTKGVGKGTGLGLSMVQGLVAQSGGRLTLRSALGRGTVAELYLPVAAQALEQALPASPLPLPIPSRPLTVLAVDDDALVLANTAAMLEDLGHRVIPAATANEALDRLRGGASVDLVVTDQLMPEMTGLELAAVIAEAWPRIPVLLVTGLVDFDVNAGKNIRILAKPFAQDDLAAAIRDVAASASVIQLNQRRGS